MVQIFLDRLKKLAALLLAAAVFLPPTLAAADRSADKVRARGSLPTSGGVVQFPDLGYFRVRMNMPAVSRRLEYKAENSDFDALWAVSEPSFDIPCEGWAQSVVLVFGANATARALPSVRIWNPYLRPGDTWTEYMVDDSLPGAILLRRSLRVSEHAGPGLRFPSQAAVWNIRAHHRYVWLFCGPPIASAHAMHERSARVSKHAVMTAENVAV